MKTTTLLFIIFSSLTVSAQKAKLIGTWISAQNDCLEIRDTLNQYDNSNMLCNAWRDEGMAFEQIGDTLSFQKRYYSSRTDYKILYTDRYDLLITHQTDTSLSILPCDSLSKKFFDNRKELNLIKQEYARDGSIKFDKIVFHTTSCFGDCPIIHMEIHPQKHVYINGVFPIITNEKDSDGYFTGLLTDSMYSELIQALQTCNLRTLTFPRQRGFDGSTVTLIIYYNGERKYLCSMFPPVIANKLIDYLYSVKGRTSLIRTNEECKLEDQLDPLDKILETLKNKKP
jgi:hypothetical protein